MYPTQRFKWPKKGWKFSEGKKIWGTLTTREAEMRRREEEKKRPLKQTCRGVRETVSIDFFSSLSSVWFILIFLWVCVCFSSGIQFWLAFERYESKGMVCKMTLEVNLSVCTLCKYVLYSVCVIVIRIVPMWLPAMHLLATGECSNGDPFIQNGNWSIFSTQIPQWNLCMAQYNTWNNLHIHMQTRTRFEFKICREWTFSASRQLWNPALSWLIEWMLCLLFFPLQLIAMI